jgi:hypothetical protein
VHPIAQTFMDSVTGYCRIDMFINARGVRGDLTLYELRRSGVRSIAESRWCTAFAAAFVLNRIGS